MSLSVPSLYHSLEFILSYLPYSITLFRICILNRLSRIHPLVHLYCNFSCQRQSHFPPVVPYSPHNWSFCLLVSFLSLLHPAARVILLKSDCHTLIPIEVGVKSKIHNTACKALVGEEKLFLYSLMFNKWGPVN